MSCDVAKFTITKGVENTFVFTIKADGSTLPMEITSTDSFVADLIPLDPLDTVTGISGLVLSLPTNLLSGKVTLVIPASSTDSLVKDMGNKADRYYLRPVYKLVIKCTTQNNGNFIAKVPEVYVD
jgi:hypothetical protein